MSSKPIALVAIILFSISLLSSCAVTTESTEASSETFENTSDASTELTSSTSERDEEEKQAVRVLRFVKANFSRIRSDMAVGKGEYLTTLAVLLRIDDAKSQEFYQLSKNNFNHLFVSDETSAEQLVANLHKQIEQAQL